MNLKRKSPNLLYKTIVVLVIFAGAFLFHFMYEWAGENMFIGLFSATDESVFQHTKILYYPYVIVAIVQFFMFDKLPNNFWVAKGIGAILVFLLVIVGFYTYTGIVGENYMWVDISSTLLYIILAESLYYKLIKNIEFKVLTKVIVIILNIIIITMTFIFTVNPPELPLFLDYSKL